MNETRTPEPTPEQLLQGIEAQLYLARAKRATGQTGTKRTVLLAAGLFVIVAGCAASLLVLQNLLSDLQQRVPTPPAQTEPADESAK